MERDPLRYVWQQTRLLHLGVLAGLILLIPATWLALDLPRAIVDNAVLGRIFGNARVAPFLPIILDLPYPLLEEPWVIFQGLSVERKAYFVYGCLALIAVILVRSLLLTSIAVARGSIARKLAGELRRSLFHRLVTARASARDDAANAAELSGPGIATIGPFLGDALILPALAIGQILVAVLFAAAVHPWFGVTLLAVALVHAFVVPWREAVQEARVDARVAREREVFRATQDVTGRSLAIRIHGTAQSEEAAFTQTLARLDLTWSGFGRRLALADLVAGFAREAGPVAVLAIGGFFVFAGKITLGSLVAVLLAVILLPRPVTALVDWRRRRDQARSVFQDIGRTMGALQARERRDPKPLELTSVIGTLKAQNLAALDPVSGVRVAGIDMAVELPSNVALVGDINSGADVFAGVVGGSVDPSSGNLTLAGVELADLKPSERARHIAFAGGAPVFLPGTLRDNLLYGVGTGKAGKAQVSDKDLVEALTLAGLDNQVYALGLAGTVDGAAGPDTASAVVEARYAVRDGLIKAGCANLVDPFDPATYNTHATVAENLMFGMPVGDTFREANLARHPFVRAVLEAEGLTGYLEQKGLEIAKSMVEIFEGVPDGHPLFQRFSFFSAGERGAYEDLLARQTERRRGAGAARDRDLLIALAFRYVETRHRLGLLDPAFEGRVVKARSTFRSLLPQSLHPAVEFYDPDKICSAASLADNLLFGRVAHDVAGAEARVRSVVRDVLKEHSLDATVFEIGLSSWVDEREQRSLSARTAAVDLARCLVRKPEILVVTRALEGLGEAEARALISRLSAAFIGRTLMIVLSDRRYADGFASVLSFERGSLVSETA